MTAAAIWRKIVVLPALGGDTTSARWPKPIGTNKSIRRGAIGVGPVSRVMRRLGCIGVSFSKGIRDVANFLGLSFCWVWCLEIDTFLSVSQGYNPWSFHIKKFVKTTTTRCTRGLAQDGFASGGRAGAQHCDVIVNK